MEDVVTALGYTGVSFLIFAVIPHSFTVFELDEAVIKRTQRAGYVSSLIGSICLFIFAILQDNHALYSFIGLVVANLIVLVINIVQQCRGERETALYWKIWIYNDG